VRCAQLINLAPSKKPCSTFDFQGETRCASHRVGRAPCVYMTAEARCRHSAARLPAADCRRAANGTRVHRR
jgi:hypothetical protein